MKMKIAIIMERADLALGGAERSVFELADALSQLGREVHILAAKARADTANLYILCQDAPGKRIPFATYEKALKKHLSENSYDIIHSVLPFKFADVYQPRGGTYAEAILRNAASYQSKFLESYKKLTAFANFRRRQLCRAERKLCHDRNGPVVAALSKYVARQFKQHYGLSEERIAIVPNGVKTDKPTDMDASARIRMKILAQLNLKETDNAVFFLFAANNFRLKGLATLIKAMQSAIRHDIANRIYLIVAGSDRTHQYRRLAGRLGVLNKIIFLGPVRHIQNVLSVIDVAVLPTFYDPCSRFILEALAAGKPVITTRLNGATEQFLNDRHGRVVELPENTSDLTEAICYFSDKSNIQKASKAITADNLREKISIRRVAKQLISLYESILQRKGR